MATSSSGTRVDDENRGSPSKSSSKNNNTLIERPVKGKWSVGSSRASSRDGRGGVPTNADITATPVAYWSLYRYANRLDKLYLAIGLIGAMANGVTMPLFSIIFGDIMNEFGLNIFDPNALSNQVSSSVPKFIYLGLAAFVASILQTYFLVFSSVRQVNRMRSSYLRSVLRQDVGFYDATATSGFLLQGLNEDCTFIQAAIGEKISMFVYMMSTAIAGIVIAITKGWDMALVIMSLLPVLAATGYAIGVLVSKVTATSNRAYAEANTLAAQSLGNVRTVYAFNGEERTVTEYGKALQHPMEVGIKQGIYSGFTIGITNCVAYCGYALAMWYGAQRVSAGAYTGGEVLNVLFAALIGGFALGQAVPNWQGFQDGKISAARLYGIMRRKPAIDSDAPGEEPETVEGHVEFCNVQFAYPARPDKPVFNDFSLSVPAGKTVALVGESGSGKSTAISLIERFYDPQAGSVFLDGIDLRTLSLRWLRSRVGLVSQEPTLFATTIRENILFGKPGSTEAEVEAAARAANAHAFISALPKGYDTHVGEKGVQMSGGQKQRIAIARAILKDPRVLLLDEATSALDSKSERVVQDALDRLMVGRTTIVVAHRLSTVVNADSIAVVKAGHVVEQGRHQDLMDAGGVYSALVHLQHNAHDALGSTTSSTTHILEEISSEAQGFFQKAVSSIGWAVGSSQTASTGSSRASSEISEALPVSRTSSTAMAATEAGEVSVGRARSAPSPGQEKKVLAQSRRGFLRRRIRTPVGAEEPPLKEKKGAINGEIKPVPISRLANLNRPELPASIGGILGSCVMGMLMPVFSIAFSSLIGVFYLGEPAAIESGAQKWALVFMGVGFAALLAAMLQSYCFNFMGQRLAARVRVLMMRALLRQEVGWYDDERNSSGILTSKLSADAMAVKGQFGDTMGLITQNIVTLVGGYIIAGVYSWRMMLVVTACLPVLLIAVMIQTKLILAHVNNETETFATANQTASEAFSSIRTVAAFCMEDKVADLYKDQLKEPTKSARHRILFAGIGFGFTQLTIFAIFSVAFWYAGLEVSRGYSSFVDVMKAFFAIFLAAFSLSQAQLHFPDVAKGKAATQRVFSIIDRQPLIDASDSKGDRPTECAGAIELKNVTFAYPQRADASVFKDFSLSVPAGKTVALVGESGSGKSTIISLIERFYDPQAGAVLLDGVDIRSLSLHWLRSQVGLVSQEPILFNLTVADNIRYGRPEATLEQVEAAARAANAHTFIEALPEGYHTKLGEGNIQLSGGQKQRIAIARAVVKDPRVLLLDEATSALDAESERVVQDALDRLMVGRTTVVVAHRLSTVRDADAIAVVYKGHIVEQGTHDELVAKGGSYARLVVHQMMR